MIRILPGILLLSVLTIPKMAGITAELKMNSRLDFYSFEDKGEMLLHLPPGLNGKSLAIQTTVEDKPSGTWKGIASGKIIRLEFSIDLVPGKYSVKAYIAAGDNDGTEQLLFASAVLIILPYKSNEVKTDRLTGGMIVNRRQLFPFGFFCYSPVHDALPEEEIVKGFNMISPYQKNLPETIKERKKYMDRCAGIGMKVHYNLLSVSGGGGVGSKLEGKTDEQKKALLVNEIMTFRDHPALLAWYIADEPNGYRISPDFLLEIYNTIKDLDPWHPVSIVVMAPFLSGARMYQEAYDIVMADPYPLPNLPASLVGNVAGQLKKEFSFQKSVWIAPQAFGGGELWSREPTIQELRSMTYQSIIKGATGIQYFVRQGLNYFPKSTAAWGECGRMAMEIAELTPWLLTDEEPAEVTSATDNIIITTGIHDNQLMIMAANLKNEPGKAQFKIHRPLNGKARAIFENRSVTVSNGNLTDQISAFGTLVYLIDLKDSINRKYSSPKNLVRDPGFEDMSSPGIPSACYARPGDDRGATYFIDTREHYEGTHSLRIVTPADNRGLYLRFFPVSVSAGKSYMISLWAKADPDQRIKTTHMIPDQYAEDKAKLQFAEISLGGFSTSRFVPDKDWKKYVTFVTIPADTVPELKANIILKMPGSGVAWFDLLEMIEDPLPSEAEAEKN